MDEPQRTGSRAPTHAKSDVAALYQLVGSRPRMHLALRPTPIQKLERLSRLLGCSIYCKRDDLTGFGFGGNKIRKLEYLIRDAVDRDADAIVTCGSNQSNWCRMTAVAGIAANLDVHLVLGGGTPKRLTGNLLLNRVAGARLHHVDTEEDAELERVASELADTMSGDARKAVRFVMGGSDGLGTLGYVDAFREILEFEARNRLEFDTIVVATGSGGTQAGLIVGQQLSGWQGTVIGMTASRSMTAQLEQVRRVIGRFDELAGTELSGAEVVTNDSYVGDGYRKRTAGCDEAIELFARTEGIFLDRVYTGKAAAGLIDYARSGRFQPTENVLFIHTGGNVQLFE